MFLDIPDFTQVGCESFTKSPVVAGLESYLEKIQTRGMSKEIYRQVEQILPGTLDSIDPMRLTINPSRIMKDVGIESIGRKIGAFSIIGVVVAIVLRLIAWVINKFKGDKGGNSSNSNANNSGSGNYAVQVQIATDGIKKSVDQIKKRQSVVIDDYCAKVAEKVKQVKSEKMKTVDAKPSNDLTPDEIAEQYATVAKEVSLPTPVAAAIKEAISAERSDDKHDRAADRKEIEAKRIELENKNDAYIKLVIGSFKANCKNDPKYKQALEKVKQFKGDAVIDIAVLSSVFKYGIVGIDTINRYEEFVGPFLEANRVDKIAIYLSNIVNTVSNIPTHKNDYKKWIKDLETARKNATAVSKILQLATKLIKFDEDTLGLELDNFRGKYNSYVELFEFHESACDAITDMRSMDGFINMASKVTYNCPATIFDISDAAVSYYKTMEKELEIGAKVDQKELEKRLSELESNPDWDGGEVKSVVQQLSTFSVTVMSVLDSIIKLQLRNVKTRQKYMRG